LVICLIVTEEDSLESPKAHYETVETGKAVREALQQAGRPAATARCFIRAKTVIASAVKITAKW
jgi:hypothetical protein